MKYGNVELHNVWDIREVDGEPGVRTCRLPLAILDSINDGAKMRSFAGSACEIRGMWPPGGKARVVLERKSENIVPAMAETFFGCFLDGAIELGNGPVEIPIELPGNLSLMENITRERKLPFAARLVRIRLPHLHDTSIHAVEGDLTYPDPGTTPDTTMLAYGSSITHGAHAIRPSGTYAAQAALHLGCDLVNLGVGGSAQMDDAIAKHIATRDDWDFATFEMGINVRGWPREKFRAAVDNFVSTIHTAQPDKPLFCIDLFTNNCDFMRDPDLGVGFRETVAQIVENQKSDKVFYVDGRTILTDPTGLRPDLVHPGDDGMQEMGRNLAERIRAELPTSFGGQ
jgi:lysophospholipase L1-like esterase